MRRNIEKQETRSVTPAIRICCAYAAILLASSKIHEGYNDENDPIFNEIY
jgi:hypothetical protein